MVTLTNVGLMIYFALVSFVGTLGNGIILLAYGNRWNSSKSTSVVFILVLACVDLWTCLVVVPAIAIMEYNFFEVPTLVCRFYSFSKILIIISSLIMSFIALDRFLNIAAPHYRLLNPCRVKFLLTLFILIGVGLGILTALAFASVPSLNSYLVYFNTSLPNESHQLIDSPQIIFISHEYNNASESTLLSLFHAELNLTDDANDTNINFSFISTHLKCFADTSIISETTREILRHISNKCFFISIGIVAIFYTITFVLALQRQNPRIRALKKSLYVLNKFNSSSLNQDPANNRARPQRTDSIVSTYSTLYASVRKQPTKQEPKHLSSLTDENQLCSVPNFINNDEFSDQNILTEPKIDFPMSRSETASDDLPTSTEKFVNFKQVSFQIQDNGNTTINQDDPQLLSISNSFDTNSTQNKELYYKFSCPCLKTQQFFIRFHFPNLKFDIFQRLGCFSYCFRKPSLSSNDHELPMIASPDDETLNMLSSSTNTSQAQNTYLSNSAIIKKQLHRHRWKQIRMALTFLLITVSFVVFYLPSILSAERYIKSPIMIYYLYLCTHALNPIIYCFMNRSLRDYVCTMLRCKRKHKERNVTCGPTTVLER